MKTKPIHLFVSTSTLIVLAVTLGCNKQKYFPCRDPENFPLTSYMLSKVPHTGNDTLIFYNQYNDTVFLRGTGIQLYNQNIYADGSMDCGQELLIANGKRFNYQQDAKLSNSNLVFPISSVSLVSVDQSSDKGSVFFQDKNYSKDIQIRIERLSDEFYTEIVTLENMNTKTVSADNRDRNKGKKTLEVYYNHYQGLVRVKAFNTDTIIWNRLFNQ